MRTAAMSALLVLALPLGVQAASAARKHKIAGEPAPELPRLPPPPPLHPPRVATEPVTFVWPPEGSTIAASGQFILGNVADPKARLTINGQPIEVYRNGAFLAYLPIVPGSFTFHAELELPAGTTAADRRIWVPLPPQPLPDKPIAIDRASLQPRGELELRPGDWWTVRMKGTRGQKARFRVGKGPWRELREANPALGIYESVQQVAPGEEFGPAPVEYELGSGWGAVKEKGPANVLASGRATQIASVRSNPNGYANLRTGPANGFMLFPQTGVRFPATGRDGGSVRVQLAGSLSGWVDAKDVELSTAAAPPRAVTGDIGVVASSAGAVVRVSLSERVAFDALAHDDLGGLTLRLFSAVGHTNWIVYDSAQDFVDSASWRQAESDVVEVRVRLKPGRKLWGWNARYDAGSSLRVDLRRPPLVDAKKPLAGLKILLDPGHMPSASGSTGPLGTKEMDANYAIAEATAKLLEKEGAIPMLTRSTTFHELGLVERPRQALERGADLFVSVHNNALPDGANPFAKPRGFTVFYYHPQSLELGRAVHAAFRERSPLPDEGLQWGNLLVARLTAMPSILIENAHMIVPEQEAMLNDHLFREMLARATVQGLRAFALSAGEKKPK